MQQRLLTKALQCSLGLILGISLAQADCSTEEVFDYSTGMCTMLPMPDMPMQMLMIHGNGFAVGTTQQGPRGQRGLAAPHMLMMDLGSSLGESHFINLSVMGTFEKWTLPKKGYPLLLQIGEENAAGEPFIDAQHPHSSPIMGLTLSDTIKIPGGARNNVKLFIAPRGQTTDGPIPFMHRATGMVNSDAPLGHHIGQDVGHVSSTVMGASLRLSDSIIETSIFNGTEPHPTAVDLPIGKPNSWALRAIYEVTPTTTLMASLARVQEHGPHHDNDSQAWRKSASLYNKFYLADHLTLQNSVIYGGLREGSPTETLHSWTEEFLLQRFSSRLWGRIELLQRTAKQLQLANPSSDFDEEQKRWVLAPTVGYSHRIAESSGLEFHLGASVSKAILPSDFQFAYGGNPWTGRLFLQVSGMQHWDLGSGN